MQAIIDRLTSAEAALLGVNGYAVRDQDRVNKALLEIQAVLSLMAFGNAAESQMADDKPPETSCARSLRRLVSRQPTVLSSLQVPLLDDAADEIDRLAHQVMTLQATLALASTHVAKDSAGSLLESKREG
jgi:hypothetical protein